MVILILGLGNTLMSDDGFGVRVIEELASRCRFREAVTLLDGGSLGMDLLAHFEGVERLLIVDALEMHAAPGTIFRLLGAEVPGACAGRLSVHQLGLPELLAFAELQGCLPRELVVWGVQPECVGMGTELSKTTAAALEPVVAGIVDELRKWGVVRAS
jgi:hydrogenase maturation protease